jgi:hypothetical protein
MEVQYNESEMKKDNLNIKLIFYSVSDMLKYKIKKFDKSNCQIFLRYVVMLEELLRD